MRYSTLFTAVLLGVTFQVHAQFLEVGGSPNVVGSGARALGMGGAFIAVADDATAASWNPGGLVQLERPELSLVYEYSLRSEDFSSERQPDMDGRDSLDLNALNYLSIVYPVPFPIWDRNLVLSLNYQKRYDLNRELDYGVRLRSQIAPALNRNLYDYRQEGSLNALSPALAFEVTKRLSVGLAVNFYRDGIGENEWKESYDIRGSVVSPLAADTLIRGRLSRKYDDTNGTNYTFGALWNATDRLSFGAVYHSPLVLEAQRTSTMAVMTFLSSGGFAPIGAFRREAWRIEFPPAYGLGVAYRFPNDKCTISLDVTRREWSDFVAISANGRRYNPVTGLAKLQSPLKNAYTVRAGAEYVFVDETKFVQNYLPSLRAGLFYDPEPASGSPSDVYGATFGVGVLIKDRVNIDFAYQFRFGNGVRQDTFLDNYGRSLAEADIRQHQFLLSTVIYF